MMLNRYVCACICLVLFCTACISSPSGAFAALEPSLAIRVATPAATESLIGDPEMIDTSFAGVTLSFDPVLAQSGIAQTVPQFLEPSGFIFFDIPEHIRFDFVDPYTNRPPFVQFQPAWSVWLAHQSPVNPYLQPQIFIFPVKAFTAISPSAGERIETLRSLLDGQPWEAGVELPVLPLFNSAQDLQVQVKTIAFENGRGIRFVTRYTQEAAPLVNPATFYTFQGLSDDGEWYVSAFFPVYITELPDEISVKDWNAFFQMYPDYLTQISETVDLLSPDAFEPNLMSLDALIGSITAVPSLQPSPYPHPDFSRTYP